MRNRLCGVVLAAHCSGTKTSSRFNCTLAAQQVNSLHANDVVVRDPANASHAVQLLAGITWSNNVLCQPTPCESYIATNVTNGYLMRLPALA